MNNENIEEWIIIQQIVMDKSTDFHEGYVNDTILADEILIN